ncbi:MAG: hypothetical protein Q8M53_02115 [Burkholderiales bacterium]|nr:hypothetical protein [Burkholderiales bacterium]
MRRLFAVFVAMLLTTPVFAEEAKPAAMPPVDADPTGLIVFALLFVGMIGGFAWYIFVKERAKAKAAK